MTYPNREDRITSLEKACGHSIEYLVRLDREFPDVEMFGSQSISCYVGPGWAGILRDALAAISAANGKIHQIKQKFSGLRVYWEPSEELRERWIEWNDGGRIQGINPYKSDERYVAAETAVTMAEMASFLICERCGVKLNQRTCMGCKHV